MDDMPNDDARLNAACESLTPEERADLLMRRTIGLSEELGVPLPTLIDRMLTYAGFASVSIQGSAATASEFRLAADRIEAGLFAQATGETLRH